MSVPTEIAGSALHSEPHVDTARLPAGTSPPQRIVALRNDNGGNFNHVLALSDAMGRWFDAPTQVIDVRLRTRALGPLVMLGIRLGAVSFLRRRPALARALWRRLFHGPAPESVAPRMICSTLGRGEVPSAVLSHWWQCENVHLGRVARVGRHHFTAVIAPQGRDAIAGEIQLPLAPTRIRRSETERAGAAFRDQHRWGAQPLWSILIGGDGGGYRYQSRDWDHLAGALGQLAEQHGIRWLLTSSPRTGTEVERRLQAAIEPRHLAYSVWYAERPERILPSFLGASQRLFVTEESISMLSDALVTGKPVHALRPAQEPTDPKARHFVTAQQRARRIAPLDLAEFASATFPPLPDPWFVPLARPWCEVLREQLLPRSAQLREAMADG